MRDVINHRIENGNGSFSLTQNPRQVIGRRRFVPTIQESPDSGRQYMILDGIRVCAVDGNIMEFLDKQNSRTAKERGTRYVTCSINDMIGALIPRSDLLLSIIDEMGSAANLIGEIDPELSDIIRSRIENLRQLTKIEQLHTIS